MVINNEASAFVKQLSHRDVGESTKNFVEVPNIEDVDNYLLDIESGKLECLTLYGEEEHRLFIIGKPGFYYITIFCDESEGYTYNDQTKDASKIEIAGDYWPSFSVCKNSNILRAIVHEFYYSGQPFRSEHWIHFSDD